MKRLQTAIFLALLAGLLLWPAPLRAQAGHGRGRLAGTVLDAADEPIAGAMVRIEFPQGGMKQDASCDGRGNWAFMGLGPGPAMVTAAAPGYAPVRIQVKLSQVRPNPRLAIVLQRAEEILAPPPPRAPAAPVDSGYALLHSLTAFFQSMSRMKEEPEKREPQLVQIMKKAIQAREANQIDALFYARFRRMLTVIKLIMTPDNGLLVPLINREIGLFVEETTGEAWKRDGPGALARIAAALEEEIVSLQLYLDDRPQRDALKQKFAAGMEAAGSQWR